MKENPWAKDWGNNSPSKYVMLLANANPSLIRKKITHFLDAYNKKQKADNFIEQLSLQQFGEVYLNSNFKNGKIDGGRVLNLRIFVDYS